MMGVVGMNEGFNIRPIETHNMGDVKRFVQLPFRLYRDCPQWVPPLAESAMDELNAEKHPFYEFGDAQFLLAERWGNTVGRIGVFENSRYNDYNGTEEAWFGFFECKADFDYAHALLDEACNWAKDRGLEKLVGPKGMIGVENSGILVEGFERSMPMGLPYNHRYYDALLREYGFAKQNDCLSAYVSCYHEVPSQVFEMEERVKARGRFRIQHFTSKKEMRKWIPDVARVYEGAFGDQPGYYPMSEGEINAFGEQLIAISNPRYMKLVLDDD
ncbi:hypothetical protein KY320_00660, partial [Candidatus Woesearchaeota archaeon]|nr:hypothetical protein [Candidatus Woesearchaeota archaeon]